MTRKDRISTSIVMILFVLLFVPVIMVNTTYADTSYDVKWTKQFGTSGNDEVSSTTTDSANNIIVAGYTTGSLEETNAGNIDAFLRMYNSSGSVLWTKQFGTSGDDRISSTTTDSANNIIVAGNTGGSLKGTNAGYRDAFLRMYDSSGSALWTKQFGTSGDDRIYSTTTDSANNIIVAGLTSGSLEGTSAGSYDAFLRMYNSSGSVLWTKQFGTNDYDKISSTTTDSANNIIVAGNTGGSLEETRAGYIDAFLRMYNSSGSVLWTKQFGTSGDDRIYSTTTDSVNNIIVAGYTTGSLEETNAGHSDAFLRMYDSSGNVLWTKQFGTSIHDQIYSTTTDSANNIIVAGYTSGSLEGINAGSRDAFLRMYNSSGSVLWTKQFGTSEDDKIYSITTDSANNIIVAGNTGGSLEETNAGYIDAFLRMYDSLHTSTHTAYTTVNGSKCWLQWDAYPTFMNERNAKWDCYAEYNGQSGDVFTLVPHDTNRYTAYTTVNGSKCWLQWDTTLTSTNERNAKWDCNADHNGQSGDVFTLVQHYTNRYTAHITVDGNQCWLQWDAYPTFMNERNAKWDCDTTYGESIQTSILNLVS